MDATQRNKQHIEFYGITSQCYGIENNYVIAIKNFYGRPNIMAVFIYDLFSGNLRKLDVLLLWLNNQQENLIIMKVSCAILLWRNMRA